MLGKLAVVGIVAIMGGIAVTATHQGSQTPSHVPTIIERTAECTHWPMDVVTHMSNEFTARHLSPAASVGFARSVPTGYRISVYVASDGYNCERVSTAQALENLPQPGIVTIDGTRQHTDGTYDMYSIVEVVSSQPGATRTFVLATKPVHVTVGQQGT